MSSQMTTNLTFKSNAGEFLNNPTAKNSQKYKAISISSEIPQIEDHVESNKNDR